MKESAFDCSLYPHDPSEGIRCLQFANEEQNFYSYNPDFNDFINEGMERGEEKRVIIEIEIDGKKQLIDTVQNTDGTFDVYNRKDLERQKKTVLFKVKRNSDGNYVEVVPKRK